MRFACCSRCIPSNWMHLIGQVSHHALGRCWFDTRICVWEKKNTETWHSQSDVEFVRDRARALILHMCVCATKLFFCVSVYILSINFNDIILCYYSILFLFSLYRVFALSSIVVISSMLVSFIFHSFSRLCPFVYLFTFFFVCYHLQTFLFCLMRECVCIMNPFIPFSLFLISSLSIALLIYFN